MNKLSKRTVCLMSVLALSAGVLAGCGPAGCSSSGNETTTAESTVEQKSVEATLYSFSGNEAVVQYDGAKYTLDLSNAKIESTSLNVGDVLVITFEGELKADDPSACKVVLVSTKADIEGSHELVGTLEDITMNSITLRELDGRKVTFNANNAEHSFAYGLDKGNWVTVVYTGELKDTDTSNISVVRIHDMDTDYVKEVKAQSTVTDAKETVYALQDVELHSSYMMASDVVGTVKAQRELQLTGHCNNGWDRVTFEGKDAYVYSSYLTTQSNESASAGSTTGVSQKVKLKEVNETVYAKSDATVRAGYSTSAKAVGALKAGASVKRTGICDNGWSRVSYNGQVAFVYSNLLTTKNPNTETKGVKVTAVNETVYMVVGEANVRKSWSTDSDAIGSLKYGMKVSRTGICDNGWSRIVFNGADAYINSDLISKTDPNAKKTVTVYKTTGYAWAATDCDVRESYSADAKSMGKLTKGSGIKITGVTDNNWSRVEFNGKVGYVNNDMLTSEDPNPAKTEEKADSKATEKTDTKTEEKSTEKTDTKAEEKATEQTDTKTEEQSETKTDDQSTEQQSEQTNEQAEEQTEQTEEQSSEQTEEQPEQTEEQSSEQADTQAEEQATEQTDEQSSEQPAEQTEEEQAEKTEEQQDEQPVETHDIEGMVVGYNLESITIRVANDKDANAPTGDSDYDNAKGDVSTYCTFDISDASQEYAQGVYEGLTVKVSYTGELSAMEHVRATKVTDSGVKQAKEATFRGSVVSATENTVTVKLADSVESTFNFEGAEVDAEKLVAGAEVTITADIKDAKPEDNVFKATKIEIAE